MPRSSRGYSPGGDSRLGPVILESYKKGCRFDSWDEHFRYEIWEENLNSLLPEWQGLMLKRDETEILPWQAAGTGYEKLTEVMRKREGIAESRKQSTAHGEALDTEAIGMAMERFRLKYGVAETVRLRLAKTGRARFIPHIDFIEIIKRSLRMSGLPMGLYPGLQ